MTMTFLDESFENSRTTADYNYFLLIVSSSPYVQDDLKPTTPTPDNFTKVSNPLDFWWNVLDQQYLRHKLGWTIGLVVAYMLILIVGIIGNCMVILVVIFRPQMRTVTNMFITNLAVADLFVIVFCVPGTLLANVFTPWILGSFMCKGVAYIQGVSVCASAYSLAAISLDRCKAIYRPMERPSGLSKSQALSTICLIWMVALLMTLPWAIIFNVMQSPIDGLTYCIETWENEKNGKIYFLVANLIFCYSLPLVLISVSNVVIWCHVSRRKVPQDTASAGTIKRMHRKTRHGVRKMLGIVTLAFLLSWLPLYVIVTRIKFSTVGDTEASVLDILMPFAQWLGHWNSCINPVLYAFLNSKFREMFKSLLPDWVPFVHYGNRNNMGRENVTNGTFTGTQGRPSCATAVFTTRSSTSTNSYRPCGNMGAAKKRGVNNRSNLLVRSFRGDLAIGPVTKIHESSTPTTSAATVSSVVVGSGVDREGNCNVVMTRTVVMLSTATNPQTEQSILTDL